MKLAVILGSTRDGRLGGRVAKWVMNQASYREEWDAELLDVREFELPLFSSANLPSMMGGEYDDPAVTQWASKIRQADAFIFVTPEYNHGLPAPLKNAIDSLYPEWGNKAAGIVSYSSGGGAGIRAAEQLRQVLSHVAVANVQTQVTIARAAELVSEDGASNEDLDGMLMGQLIQLSNWAGALKPLRQKAAAMKASR